MALLASACIRCVERGQEPFRHYTPAAKAAVAKELQALLNCTICGAQRQPMCMCVAPAFCSGAQVGCYRAGLCQRARAA